ncbi:MAG TPA: NAD(P)/FAD-dependent oxidoreductase [Acetobacteraceae bacterium]|jgi:thioredoxin reductase/bacterioferritin-associated ferredoxin|nr:NAD(P)/FAD-dependent oxidoreductase [Acetobacteraceae bacterium]
MTLRTACELAIIGGGPAGMAAATQASALGIDTLVLDEQPAPGGQIHRGIETVQATRAADMRILGEDYAEGAVLTATFRASGAAYEPGSVVWQALEDGRIGVSCDGASRMLTARRILITTGAMERPVPLPGWTLPGVMGAGAAQTLLKASGMVPDVPVAIIGTGPLIYLIAAQFVRAGVQIAAVLLTAPEVGMADAIKLLPGAMRSGRTLLKGLAWRSELRSAGVRMLHGVSRPVIEGAGQVESVSYTHGGVRHRTPVGLVLLHNGVIPNTQLSLATRCKHEWDARQQYWRPQTDEWSATSHARIAVAGDGAGIMGARAAASQGRMAALDAAVRLGKIDAARRDAMVSDDRAELERQHALREMLDRLFQPAQELLAPTGIGGVVCRCEDVTVSELEDAVEKGCTDVNRVKAFTRCGMGPCQGRMCGPTVAQVIARKLGQTPDVPGQFRIRLPVRPISLAELAELQT